MPASAPAATPLNKTTINIKGGEITATGGVSLDSRNHSDKWLSGAGIGSGSNVSGETEINISGDSTIKSASGGKYGGAGIGSGSYSGSTPDSKKGAVTINITGGNIEKATGGGEYVSSSKRWYSGAGIGAGLNAGTTTINIKDNAHIVSATGGKYGGAGIGSGSSDTKTTARRALSPSTSPTAPLKRPRARTAAPASVQAITVALPRSTSPVTPNSKTSRVAISLPASAQAMTPTRWTS